MARLAVVGALASTVTTAVVFSRDGNVAADPARRDSRQAFVQPKNRDVAEARFIAMASGSASGLATVAMAEPPAQDKPLEVANFVPLARPRPVTPGYYYELVRAQGDGEEGEYVLVERQCILKVDMPEPCYLPERDRQNFPLRSE